MHDSDVSVPAAGAATIPDAEYDAAWVGGAYDRFADRLYAYCRSLVREPAAAAEALRDTFVVTALRLADLPEENQLRAWLHAVARNECLRAISAGTASAAPDFRPGGQELTTEGAPPAEGPAGTDETAPDVLAGGEDGQARELLGSALGGLGPAERDFMLMIWHGLEVAECAAILGVSPDTAAKILFRGRDQLEAAAGVLAVARSGGRDCADLAAVLASGDGRLTLGLADRLRQHVDRCDACGERRRAGMRPAVLLRLAPGSLRGMAAAAGAPALAAGTTTRLRDQVLAAAFEPEPQSFEHRAMVVRRAGPFRDADGFPVPLPVGRPGARRHRRPPLPLVLAGAGGTGLLVAAALVGVALTNSHSTGAMPAWAGLVRPETVTAAGGRSDLPLAASLSPASAGSPTDATTGTGAAAGSPGPAGAATGPAGTLGATPPAASTGAAQPTATAPARGPAAPAQPPVPAARPQVKVAPGSLALTRNDFGFYGEWFTLVNPTGAAVNWSIALPSDLMMFSMGGRPGDSGTLGADATSTQMYLFYLGARGHGGGSGSPQTETITVQPGNMTVQVTIPAQ
ncbi:MAG TPA: RNA polymerase sigma factor [Trebonia sp.]|nr:RNA polymerase sigma factor [Trebonia sp.]